MTHAKTLVAGLMLLAVLALAGCGDTRPDAKKDKDSTSKDGKKDDDHKHGEGPNGGLVFDFGKYHAELKIEHPKKEMTVWILGSDEKTPEPVTCKELTVTTKETKTEKGDVVKPMTITLKPVDEKNGKATKFVGTDPGLEQVADHEGVLFGEVNGKPAKDKFKEK